MSYGKDKPSLSASLMCEVASGGITLPVSTDSLVEGSEEAVLHLTSPSLEHYPHPTLPCSMEHPPLAVPPMLAQGSQMTVPGSCSLSVLY